jgi:AraC-like DNA-binding protein
MIILGSNIRKKIMDGTNIYIRNMVCPRCIRVVNEELTKGGFKVTHVELGKATIADANPDKAKLSRILLDNGFELLEEKSARLISEMKVYIIQYIREGDAEDEKLKLSSRLERHFGKEYGTLSQIFSASENTTLEKFVIAQKIELVKEWLIYNELTLSETAWKLGYKSVAHLSSQFKHLTGFSPTEFKKLKDHHRKMLDSI